MILRRLWQHDLAWSFRRSPVTIVATALTLIWVGAALLAPWVSPQAANPRHKPMDAAITAIFPVMLASVRPNRWGAEKVIHCPVEIKRV